MADVTNNTSSSQTYDNQQLIEEIEAGDQKVPSFNVDADYEVAKAYSTGLSAEEAASVTAPQLEIPEPEQTELKIEPTGDPGEFRNMARELNTVATGTNITDELVEKALQNNL